jgi:hypothetical protein
MVQLWRAITLEWNDSNTVDMSGPIPLDLRFAECPPGRPLLLSEHTHNRGVPSLLLG